MENWKKKKRVKQQSESVRSYGVHSRRLWEVKSYKGLKNDKLKVENCKKKKRVKQVSQLEVMQCIAGGSGRLNHIRVFRN